MDLPSLFQIGMALERVLPLWNYSQMISLHMQITRSTNQLVSSPPWDHNHPSKVVRLLLHPHFHQRARHTYPPAAAVT